MLREKLDSKLRNYFASIELQGVTVTFLLVFAFLILSANIFRAFTNAQNNSQIYNLELNNFESLKNRNLELKDDLEYFTSDEYKKIFLRETQFLAQPDETIYSTRQRPVYIQERITRFVVKDIVDYSSWWKKIFLGN